MIRFEKVSFAYDPGRPLIRDLDLEIGPGLTLIIGPNGSGKSTLLKLAAGVEPPDRGRIFIEGFNLWTAEAAARRSANRVVPGRQERDPSRSRTQSRLAAPCDDS